MSRSSYLIALTLVCFCWAAPNPMEAEPPQPAQEPEVLWLFPLGGQRGEALEVEIRGRALQGAYAVIFEEEGVGGQVTQVDEVVEKSEGEEKQAEDAEKKKNKDQRVVATVDIDPAARVGNHWLRVVTPQGVTNAFHFQVNALEVIKELDTPHHLPNRAQPIDYPVVVNGRITGPGEMDYYKLRVPKGQELLFEVTPSRGAVANVFRSQLAIYAREGSWFDSERVVRLAFSDKDRGRRVTSNRDPRQRTGTRVNLRHRFLEEGHYFVEVGSLSGQAQPDFVYQLKVVPSGHPLPAEEAEEGWQERSFTRQLKPDRLRELWARGVRVASPSSNPKPETDSEDSKEPDPAQLDAELSDPKRVPEVLSEKEPNGGLSEALKIPVPGIVEGTVERPGDVDFYKIEVSSGQKLAFEFETPGATRPDFNPWMEILDSRGRDQLSNLQRTDKYTKNTSVHLISLDPKVIGTFEKGGDYFIRVRDVTRRKGEAAFAYRLLVRPQVPHVGNLILETRTRDFDDGRVDPHRINLSPGEATKFTLILEQEEGFFLPSNQIAVAVEGLPPGVKAFPGASSYKLPGDPGPPKVRNPESHLPETQKVAIVLYAPDDVQPTRLPVWLTVTAQPFVGGQAGAKLTAKKIPLMILSPASAKKISRLAGDSSGSQR